MSVDMLPKTPRGKEGNRSPWKQQHGRSREMLVQEEDEEMGEADQPTSTPMQTASTPPMYHHQHELGDLIDNMGRWNLQIADKPPAFEPSTPAKHDDGGRRGAFHLPLAVVTPQPAQNVGHADLYGQLKLNMAALRLK